MAEEVNMFQKTCPVSNVSDEQNPFTLRSTFAFRKQVGLRLSLNKDDELIMIYCMSNIICLYNIVKNTWKYVTGHVNRITHLVISSNGRILISIDTENVHIWDLKCPDSDSAVILKVIKTPFENFIEVAQAAISSCSRYLVLVSSFHEIEHRKSESDLENKSINGYKIQLWEWSFDREIYDDVIQIFDDFGTVNNVTFDCNIGHEKFFVITFTQKIIFGLITEDNKISIYKPTMCRWNNSIESTMYIKNTTLAISITNDGKVILWDDGTNTNTEKQGENMKNLYKIITLKNVPFIDIKPIDDYIVIIDKDGDVRFYDQDLKLMFVCTSDQLILSKSTFISIWPDIKQRNYEINDQNVIIHDENGEKTIIPRNKCIKNYTIHGEPFIVRNFFLVNEAGELAMIDVVKKQYRMMLIPAEDFYVAMDIYPQKSWMIGCTKGSWLIICNYETSNAIAKYYFQPKDKALKGDRKILIKSDVTCIKVSHNENFVALGYNNGNLWMIDPVTAMETHEWPMKFTDCRIKMIVFKKTDNYYCALADSNNALVYIHFNGIRWEMLAKFQYHCMPIIGIFFLQNKEKNYLITIGYDRMYVRYQVFKKQQVSLIAEIDVRLDQAPKITAAEILSSKILANDTSSSGNVIVVANDQYKFVIYDAYTTENLFTFLGPIYETPIQKIIYCDARFDINESPMLLFATKKSLGAAVLPLDGNPFRYSGILAHHHEITAFQLNYDLSGVLIHGEGDVGPTYWNIERENIHNKVEFGGKGLEPFLKLLPGGKYGKFFNEMVQFFYYVQLMEDLTDAPERKTITEFIKISEIIDFMHAIGFFPSEYESKILMNEVTRTKETWVAPPTHISFTDLIKLYFNHRPADGYRFSKILENLKLLLSGRLKFAIGDSIQLHVIERGRLLDVITTKGEKIPVTQAMRYLLELLDDEDRGIKRKITELTDAQVIRNFKKLPSEINLYEFCYKVFGMESQDAEKMINIFEKTSTAEHSSILPEESDKDIRDQCLLSDTDSDEEELKNSK